MVLSSFFRLLRYQTTDILTWLSKLSVFLNISFFPNKNFEILVKLKNKKLFKYMRFFEKIKNQNKNKSRVFHHKKTPYLIEN